MSQIQSAKIIALDWNDTIQDQTGEICSRTNLKRSMFNVWSPPLGHLVGRTELEFSEWAWTDRSIQAMALPFPGVAKQIFELSKIAKIWIVSSTCNPLLLPSWFRKHNIYYDKAIITDDKGSVEWDVLLDDNPFTLEKLHSLGRNVLRHALPWNNHLTHIKSFNWS